MLAALAARGMRSVELYTKRGRSRVVERHAAGSTASYHREEGWAVRAGDDRCSLFAAASGEPDPSGPGGGWPEADGEALDLPTAERAASVPGGGWREPGDLDSPLVGEREALGLLATLCEELGEELPGARCLSARLADGASEWEVVSRVDGAEGVAASARGRVALLRVEAAFAHDRPVVCGFEAAARDARSFHPRSLARRLADRLAVAAGGTSPDRDRAPMLLAPAVGARLVAAFLPLLVGPRGPELAGRLEDRDGRLGSPALDVIDDGRLSGGVLAAPCDGEGVATSVVRLVEGGIYRQPILAWRDPGASPPGRSRGSHREAGSAEGSLGRGVGCMRRPGWRDLPRPSPSHLFVAPAVGVGVGRLLGEIARGYYLIDVDGAPSIDWAEGRLSVPVVGFAVERGRPASPLAGATVEGGVGTMLRGVSAVARDLGFFPMAGGMIGAPTMLVTGLEIRSSRRA